MAVKARTRGDNSFPPIEAKIMATRQQNVPNVQYCIEARLPVSKIVVERFTIEQCDNSRGGLGRGDDNYNVVQNRLDDLGNQTGLEYEIVLVSGVCDRSRWKRGAPLNVE